MQPNGLKILFRLTGGTTQMYFNFFLSYCKAMTTKAASELVLGFLRPAIPKRVTSERTTYLQLLHIRWKRKSPKHRWKMAHSQFYTRHNQCERGRAKTVTNLVNLNIYISLNYDWERPFLADSPRRIQRRIKTQLTTKSQVGLNHWCDAQ